MFPKYAAAVLYIIIASTFAQAGERYAFLVGVSGYDEKELKPLTYPRNDILEFRDVLQEAGYRSQNIILMVDDLAALPKTAPAGRFLPESARIRKELQILIESLEPDDSLLIALSGHGVQFQGETDSFYCPLDASLADKSSLLSLTWLYEQLKYDSQSGRGCKARQRLLLVDACRNDPASSIRRTTGGAKLQSASLPQLVPPPEGVVALFSCAEGQQALEHDPLKHGVFFYHVLQAFRGNADADADRQLTLDELILFTKAKTQEYARLNLGASQTPRQKGFFDGTWTLRSMGGYQSSTGPEIVMTPEEIERRLTVARDFMRGRNPSLAADAFDLYQQSWIWARLGETRRALELFAEGRKVDELIYLERSATTRARLLGVIKKRDPGADIVAQAAQIDADVAAEAKHIKLVSDEQYAREGKKPEIDVEAGYRERMKGLTNSAFYEPTVYVKGEPNSHHEHQLKLFSFSSDMTLAMLIQHPWYFAQHRFEVVRKPDDPVVPDDVLLLAAFRGEDAPVRRLLTDSGNRYGYAPYWSVPFAIRRRWSELDDILATVKNGKVQPVARLLAAEVAARIEPSRVPALVNGATIGSGRLSRIGSLFKTSLTGEELQEPEVLLNLAEGMQRPWSIEQSSGTWEGVNEDRAYRWRWRLAGKVGGTPQVVADSGLQMEFATTEFVIGLLEDVPLSR
jgi:hypothetical protein